jgi:alkylated DNA repair dioxygenase AlkB
MRRPIAQRGESVEESRWRIHFRVMRAMSTGPDLFGRSPLPPGLDYRTDFLDASQETALIDAFASLPFREAPFRQYTARRRVVRFGHDGYADIGELQDGGPWPAWLVDLQREAALVAHVDADAFAHALVTEYRPGTPIGWHRDKPAYGTVVGISLGSPCRMRFRPYDNQRDRNAVVAVELAPRSLYVMRDDVRWRWQHSIPPVKALRYSVTFRTRA